MKRIVVLSLLFLLTGCGTITCRTGNGSVSEIYKIKYSGNSVNGVTVLKSYSFSSNDDFKNFEPMMKHYVRLYSNDNVDVSYVKKGKKYILKQVYDIKNISDFDLVQYGLKKNKSELVDSLKSNGLSCK